MAASIATKLTASSKVIIVGGGLGGTALALALARAGIKSEIFEVREQRGDIGGAITLAPNSIRVLEHLGLWEAAQTKGSVFEVMHMVAEDGMHIGKFYNGSVKDYGYPAVRIRRSRIHEIIIEALHRDHADLVTLTFGKKCVEVIQDPTLATVRFADGTTVTGDFVIGADGLHSAVRNSVLGPGAPEPKYQGVASIGGSTTKSKLVDPTGKPLPLPCLLFGRTGSIGFMPYGSPGEDIASWFVTLEVDQERDRHGWETFLTSGEALDMAADHLKTWQGPILPLIQAARTDPKSCSLWPQYAVGDIPRWFNDRIVLIGDAAHAIPPSGGQGAAQAFEDAELLSRVFIEGKTLAGWEAERRRRVAIVIDLTKTSGDSRKVGTASPTAFFVKKWGMWAYFNVFGGGKRTDLYNYDGLKAVLS